MPTPLVRKRCFVQMTGYEPVGAEHYHRRFIREMARFLKAWSLQGEASPATVSSDGHVVSFGIETWGPNWRVHTDLHYFRWDDIVSADMAESDFRRIPLGVAAMLEFVLTGTAAKYFAIAPRYGGFFCYPLAAIIGMVWLSISFARFSVIHLGLPYPLVLAPIVLCVAFVVLRQTFGRMVFIRYALDDWYFARDMAHQARPLLEQRLDRFARELVRIARETDADEIVVDGHSLGAPISIAVVDRALQLDPQLGRGDRPLHIVSTGSSLLKVALHPAAGWLRESVRRVANSPAVYWVEYQALVDVINVYKVDPVVALGMPATGKPIVRIIRIRHMVEEHTYKRFHLNFLRIHRQAVMGNERRYFYDYYMLCCGPVRLRDRVDNQEQIVSAFAADGALIAGNVASRPAGVSAVAAG